MQWRVVVCCWVAVWVICGSALAQMRGEAPAEGTIRGGLGEGVVLQTGDESLRLQIRARAQLRTFADLPDEGPESVGFSVRRLRLALRGEAREWNVGLYVQLGFAPGDLDPAAPNVLRDAVVTWRPTRHARLLFGQTKVAFNRERVISSSALGFVDRSEVNATFNLDRDMGLQLFLERLGAGEHLSLKLGVFGGEGRNVVNTDLGLLYTARLEFTLDPDSETYSEVDFRPGNAPAEFAVGLGGGFNHKARRAASTLGAFLPEDVAFDVAHAELDMIWKWRRWCVQSEILWRQSTREVAHWVDSEGAAQNTEFASGLGWFVSVGRSFGEGWFAGVRYSELHPTGARSLVVTERRARATLGYFFFEHDLKVQLDGSAVVDPEPRAGSGDIRLQTQFFF